MAFQLEHQRERDHWRTDAQRQAEEIEKLRQEIRQLTEQKERPALPPAPRSRKLKK